MVKRLTGPSAMSANALAKEVGISQGTLSRWLREAATVRSVTPEREEKRSKKRTRSQDRTAAEKLRLVMEAASLSEEDLGAFLRRHGIHRAELEKWREQALKALEGAGPKRSRAQLSEDQKRIRELEKQLRRKEKALAETAALLVLKKKVQEIWGDEDDDTNPRSGG